MSTFIVQIFKAYDSPIAPDRAAALLSCVNNMGNIIFLSLIRFTGKRRLYLTMLTVVFLCSAIVCAYGFAILPSGYNSFDQSQHFKLDNKDLSYIPLIGIILWSFCSYCGVNIMPWQMISEVFPYKWVQEIFSVSWENIKICWILHIFQDSWHSNWIDSGTKLHFEFHQQQNILQFGNFIIDARCGPVQLHHHCHRVGVDV